MPVLHKHVAIKIIRREVSTRVLAAAFALCSAAATTTTAAATASSAADDALETTSAARARAGVLSGNFVPNKIKAPKTCVFVCEWWRTERNHHHYHTALLAGWLFKPLPRHGIRARARARTANALKILALLRLCWVKHDGVYEHEHSRTSIHTDAQIQHTHT